MRGISVFGLLVFGIAGVACASEARHVEEFGGALGERFDLTVRGNLLKLDLERDFLAPFAARREKEGFVGLGKLADALVHFAWNTSDPSVRAMKDKAISFIVSNQLADGYTGCLEPGYRMRALWDTHEMGFILQALVADAELFGNRAALEAARRNADYLMSNWHLQPPAEQRGGGICDWLRNIGLCHGLIRLSALTSDRRGLDFIHREGLCGTWDGAIVLGRGDGTRGHAYAYLSACLEQLQLNRLEPDDRLLGASRRILAFMTKGDGLLVDGAGSICECWTDDQDGEGEVGETCMVAYLLLFCRELLEQGIGDQALLGDLMERAIYNALFAAQSRDGRRLRYYTPLNGVRSFWKNDLFCCPNNFRRVVARLPEFVFRTNGDEIHADLYTACRATFEMKGTKVAIREETDYPASGRVKLVVDPSADADFALVLRLPGWCRRPSVRVNGAPVACRPGSQLRLSRIWTRGDTVELELPMAIRTILGRKRQAGRVAVLRGPVVYALDTRTVPELKDVHPYDAQTLLTLDPASLVEEEDGICASVTVFSISIAIPRATRQVRLAPFADENGTQAYFRVPDIRACGATDDELLTGGGVSGGTVPRKEGE